MPAPFPFGVDVQVLRRSGSTFAAPVVVSGGAVAPRQLSPEAPVPQWPPYSAGRDWYAPAGTVVAARDRVVYGGVTYEVDGDPEQWDSPFSGTAFGLVVHLRSTDGWFPDTIAVESYLGSSGWGASFAGVVDWPANVVSVEQVSSSQAGDEVDAVLTVRVPPTHDAADALDVFTAGSRVSAAGVSGAAVSVQPFTRDGITEYVEVKAR